jgi:glyoxylase-like metal-dependent hydrolase (beta-lactamase superfamily II)
MIGRYNEIRDRIVVLENEYDSNLTCVVLEEGLVFIDTGRRIDLAAKFREDMEKRFNRKTSHLLITHYHFDHYGAMSVFKDVEIVAAEAGYGDFSVALQTYLTKENREETVRAWKEEVESNNIEVAPGRLLHWEHYPKNDIFLPTKVVNHKQILGGENEKIIFQVTGGHSKCSAFVYIPSEEVIHVSDNLATDPNGNDGVFLGYSIFFYRPGVCKKTIDILEGIAELPVTTVIPGHGPVVSKDQVIRITQFLRKLDTIIRTSIEKKQTLGGLLADSRLNNFYKTRPEYWTTIIERQYNLISEEIIKK